MRPEINTRSVRWIFATALIFIIFLFAISFAPFKKIVVSPRTTLSPDPNDDAVVLDAKQKEAEIEAFSGAKILAKAAYVFDLTDNRAIFAKNEDMPLPLASVTKLMTALVSSQIFSDSEDVVVSTSSLLTEGDNGLTANEKWRFEDLRDFTLLVSSNDGANALAEAAALKLRSSDSAASEEVPADPSSEKLIHIFVDKMNAEALSLNLPTLHYQNPSGLDIDATTAGAIGSARDVGKLLGFMIKDHPNILEITKYDSFKFTSLSGIRHNVSNTDQVINKVSHILASKTGYTQLAGGNLVVAYDPGLSHPVIIVILGSTQAGRFQDVTTLASSTAAYLASE